MKEFIRAVTYMYTVSVCPFNEFVQGSLQLDL